MLLHHVGKDQHRLSAFQHPAAFLYHLSSGIPQMLDGGRLRLKNPKAEAVKRTNANTVTANTTISVTFDILQRAACDQH